MAFGKDGNSAGDDKKLKKRKILNSRHKDFYEVAMHDACDCGQFDENWIRHIDLSREYVTSVSFTDGSRCEMNVQAETFSVYGVDSAARNFAELAAELYFPWGAKPGVISVIETSGKAAYLQTPKRETRKASPQLNQTTQVQPEGSSNYTPAILESFWKGLGYESTSVDDGGVWVDVGKKARLYDSGHKVEIFGNVATADIARNIVQKSIADWGGQLRLEGSQSLKDACWLEAQRQGANIVDFEPSAFTKRRWALEQRFAKKGASVVVATPGDMAARVEPSFTAMPASSLQTASPAEAAAVDRIEPSKPATVVEPKPASSPSSVQSAAPTQKPVTFSGFKPVHTWLPEPVVTEAIEAVHEDEDVLEPKF